MKIKISPIIEGGYHIGRMIADKTEGENEITEFFFPKDLNHFCVGCYKCIEDVSACLYYEEKGWLDGKNLGSDVQI